jgi:hypothetical protein
MTSPLEQRKKGSFAFYGQFFLVGSDGSPSFAAGYRGRRSEHPRRPNAALIEPPAQYGGVAAGGHRIAVSLKKQRRNREAASTRLSPLPLRTLANLTAPISG